MDKVLTIGIPVFNGAKTIRDTIESVLMQLDDDLKDRVEVLISNNHSTDNTKEIIEEYATLFPDNVHIYDNDRPDLELDGNLINIFKLSKSEYVWIMTDDDAFYSNSIKHILELISLRGEDLGLIFVNYAECDECLNENAIREREDIDESCFCANGDEFFIKSKILFGLASSLIFRREAWMSAELSKYVGLKSLHIGALVEVLSCNSSYIVSEKLIKLRTGNTTWGQGGTFIFYMLNMVKMLKNTKELNYKKSTHDYLIDHFRKENYKSIIRAKLEGFSDNQKLFKETYICYGNKVRFWSLDIFLIFLPTAVLRVLKNIYKRVKK